MFCMILAGSGCWRTRDEIRSSPSVPKPADFATESTVTVPNAAFNTQTGTTGWVIGTGVAIDPAKGGKAPGALKISVATNMPGAQAGMSAPVKLQPWRRHRLSFAYQLSPGVSAGFSWAEKGTNGIAHVREGNGYIRLAPTEAFVPVSVEFISWHEPAEWKLAFGARLIQGMTKPGCFLVDDIVLESGPAVSELPAETILRAVINHGFESPQRVGYASVFQAELSVVDDSTAYEGKRCLRMKPKGDKGGAHIYIPTRGGLILKDGHCYRISARARGTGELTIGLSVPDPTRWLLDIDYTMMPKVFPLSPKQWREVHADYIMDHGDLRDVQVLLLPNGQVDIDDLEIRRLR